MRALISLIAASILAGSVLAHATEVHWIPAHEWAPQDVSNRLAAGDLDGDSDLDLSILALNPVRHYWNTGTPQVPEWELDTTQFSEVPYCGFRSGALGDADSDGDLDLVISCYDEYHRFYRNTGTPQQPEWQFEPTMFEGIEILPGGAEPYFGDLDADGDLDLAVACSFGSVVQHFENVGSPTEPQWADMGFVAGVQLGSGGHPTIALGDIDGDADLDLVTIAWSAPVQCWENTGTPQAFQFTENPSMLLGVEDPPWGKGIELLDIDADGDLDLLVAYYLGENFLYLNETVSSVEPVTWGRIKSMFR